MAPTRWRGWGNGPDPQQDVDDEFAFHLEQRIEGLRRAGLSETAAREEAMKRFGDLDKARQTYVSLATRRAARSSALALVQSFAADLRFGLRTFRRSPAFAVAVVLVAGLGIAINSAVFAALNALFLRPLPLPEAHEIVRIYTNDSKPEALYGGSSYPDYLDVRHVPSLDGLAAYVPLAANVRIGRTAVRGEGRLVSENFFQVLGVQAGIGRVFTEGDHTAAEVVPVVLGHAFWQREYGADRSIVGKPLAINGANAVVLGVVTPQFVGIEPSPVDVYFPIGRQSTLASGLEFLDDRGARLVKLIGRLGPGISEVRAANDLNVLMRALAGSYPDTNRGRLMTLTRAATLVDTSAAPVRLAPIVVLLFSVTGVLLLITTVNVAGFLLARTTSRNRELAVRLSLGASRWRILRQLMTESLVLGAVAEIVALGALLAVPWIAHRFGIPETVQFGVDTRVLAFASLVTLATALGFSIGPALRGSAKNPSQGLRESFTTMPLTRARAQRALVVVQVALSIMLLGSAILLAQSIRRQYEIEPGFDTAHVLAAEFEPPTGTAGPDQTQEFAREALRMARQLPGVFAASVTTAAPLTSEGASMSIDIPGLTPAPREALEVPFSNAGPDYCAALGLTIVEGEELRSNGATPGARAVLVNETMARMYWPRRSPVGTTIRLGDARGPAVPVIGVVADARMVTLSRPPGPYFYLQSEGDAAYALVMRTTSNAAALKPLVQRTFVNGAAEFTLRRLRSMEEVLGASLAETRAFAVATSAVSVLALLLAVSALYAFVSYLAAQRTREFGIRLALGATRRDVIRLVLSSGVRLSALGVAIGLIATFASTLALQALISAVSPLDAASVLAVAAAAGAVAVAACLVPALRAAALMPAHTLRVD
jgi:putative ABC transport system permease protein